MTECGLWPNQIGLRCDWLDQVQSMMKTRKDNEVIDCTGVVYIENDIELSWPIGSSVICDKNQIEQWYDWLYRCDLR